VALLLCAALGASGEAVYTHSRPSHAGSRPLARDFRAVAEFVRSTSNPGEMLIVPWDDFPGFFYFNTHNHYPVGLNTEYLRRGAPKRFDAFRRIYEGKAEKPERLLAVFFDDARTIIARAEPRTRGEIALLERMDANPHFTEITSPSKFWRIFRRKSRSTQKEGDADTKPARLRIARSEPR
jgi:hypothetical protein